MNGRKVRFNGVDAIILLVLAAAVGVLLYIFVFSADQSQPAGDSDLRTIRYVVEVANIDESNDTAVGIGDPVQEAVKKKHIGTVVGVQSVPFEQIVLNEEDLTMSPTSVKGKITLKITVEATVRESDQAFTVSDCAIRVGEQYSLMLPGFYGVGFCTDIIE